MEILTVGLGQMDASQSLEYNDLFEAVKEVNEQHFNFTADFEMEAARLAARMTEIFLKNEEAVFLKADDVLTMDLNEMDVIQQFIIWDAIQEHGTEYVVTDYIRNNFQNSSFDTPSGLYVVFSKSEIIGKE